MPIFPAYTGISVGTPVQTNPNVPEDPRPAQVYGLGRATERAGLAFGEAARKKSELDDEAIVMERAMRAVGDMNSIHETLQGSQNNSLNAKTLFDDGYKKAETEWYKGLNDRQATMLQKKIYGRSLEYRIGAGKIENRAKMQRYDGTMTEAGQRYVDVESRRIDPDDAAQSQEFKDYVEMGEKAVALNYMTAEQWATKKQAVLANGAYSRAHKAIASDNIEEVQHFLGIVKESKDAGKQADDKTFLKNITAEQRNTLETMAKGRVDHLRAEKVRLKNQEYTDTHRQLEEMQKATKRMASMKLSNPEKYGTLTRDWVEQAAETGLLEGDELTHYRTQAEASARSGTAETGGYGNAAVINRYSTAVFSTKSPDQALQLRTQLLADMANGNVPGGPGSVGSQYLAHLTQIAEPKISEMTPRQRSQYVKEMLKASLRVSGPGAQMLQPQEQAVMSEALEAIDKNALQGYPEDALDIYNKNIDKWRARVGTPGVMKAQELAKSQGLGYDLKGNNEATFKTHAQKLKQQFDSAPPGPEGDAIRNAVRDAARSLRRLQELDAELKRYQNLRGQAKVQNEQRKSEQQQSGPLTGPRK